MDRRPIHQLSRLQPVIPRISSLVLIRFEIRFFSFEKKYIRVRWFHPVHSEAIAKVSRTSTREPPIMLEETPLIIECYPICLLVSVSSFGRPWMPVLNI